MHEASIALSLLETAGRHCTENNYKVIDSLTVRIGKLSGVMPEALLFAFDAIKRESPAENARLIIEEINAGGACNGCNRNFLFDTSYIIECPFCSSSNIVITHGRELEFIEMEVDSDECQSSKQDT